MGRYERSISVAALNRSQARAVAIGCRHLIVAALLTAGACSRPGAQPEAPRVDEPAVAQALHRYFDPIAAAHDLSGVIRVERKGKVTEAWFGYADWDRRAPIAAATQFSAGSIAKSMVATVILRLAQEGRLNMGATVATYLPDYRYGSRMTLDQVMHHVAGIARDVPDTARAAFGPNGFLEWLNAREPVPSADGKPAYSNVGYELLALIAERVSGRPFDALVRTIIFEPLGMTQSSLQSHGLNAIGARPHEPGPPPGEVLPASDSYLSPSGSLFATSADLARWGRAVRDAEVVQLRMPDGSMAGSVSARPIAGRPALWMQGTTRGAGAVVVTFPGDDIVVVVAMNLGTYPQFNSEEVASAIALGTDPGTPPVRLPAVALSDAHRALAGAYSLPGVGAVRIRDAGGEMRLTMTGPGWDYYLSPASDGRLVWRTFNFTFAARRDPAGTLNGLKVRLHMVSQGAGGDSEVARSP